MMLVARAMRLLTRLRLLRPPMSSSMSMGPADDGVQERHAERSAGTTAPSSNPEPNVSTRHGAKMATVR